MSEVQVPAKSAESARRMCSAKLTLENDAVWHSTPAVKKTRAAAGWRLTLCGETGVTSEEIMRVLKGMGADVLSSGTRHVLKDVSPWYDTTFDPDCPRQVRQTRDEPATGSIGQEINECLDHIAYTMTVRGRGYTTGTITGRMSATGPNIQHLPKESTMSKPIEITTKTLINGSDIESRSDAELYDIIASEEKKITDLNKIENKPKRLIAEIEKRKAGIQALVNYLDSKAD